MKKPIICAALLIVIGCLAAARSNAQQTYLFSQSSCEQAGVDCESSVDLSGGMIWGYSATEVDYWTSYDYSAYVDGELSDQNGNLLDSEWDEEDVIAEVYTSTPANPGMVYTERGYHYVIARYYYEDIEKGPDGCMPCDGCNTDCYYYYDNWWWYDPFGFSFVNTGYYGPWWYLYGYGPPYEIENDETISLGQTSQSVVVGWRITSISPDHSLVGTTVPVIIFGSAFSQFGSNSISVSGYGVTARDVNFISSGVLSANFQITSDASGGNHSVRVTINGFPSNSLNFFVQIPSRFERFDYPGAPNGYGPLTLTSSTNNEVRNLVGAVLLANQCGVYRDLAYELEDQQGQPITQPFDFTETFSNYNGVSTTPPALNGHSSAGLVQDTSYFGKTLPDCPGPDDNESFDQRFIVTIGPTQYTLSTVVHFSRGRSSGNWFDDLTTTVP